MLTTENSQSANLDFLRSFAVLMVLVAHCGNALYLTVPNFVGEIGVLLFFVHTSFVLMHSLDRLHLAGGDAVALRFFIQRAFRIYPLYLAAIAFALLLRVPLVDTFDVHANTQWMGWPWLAANLLMLQNVSSLPSVSTPMWSLPFEAQMYMLLPAIYLQAKMRDGLTRALLISMLGGLSAVFLWVFLPPPYGQSSSWPLTFFVPCFMGGVIAFVVSSRARRVIPSAFLLPLLLACVGLSWRYSIPVVAWPVCTALGFVLPYFKEVRCGVARNAFHALATYSYGVYLWHWPLLWVFFRRFPAHSVTIRFLLFFSALALLSVASYRLLEAPLIRYGRTVGSSKSKRVARSCCSLTYPVKRERRACDEVDAALNADQ